MWLWQQQLTPQGLGALQDLPVAQAAAVPGSVAGAPCSRNKTAPPTKASGSSGADAL